MSLTTIFITLYALAILIYYAQRRWNLPARWRWAVGYRPSDLSLIGTSILWFITLGVKAVIA